MRLYKVTAKSESLSKVVWAGTLTEGVKVRKGLAAEGYTAKQLAQVEVDVPTTKDALLEWLNATA